MNPRKIFSKRCSFLFVFLLLSVVCISAQTTAFTYQGRFTDSTQPPPTNGSYAMEFALFDDIAAGTQIGATQSAMVTVVNGVFTVNLNFGANTFENGTARFLQITVNNTPLNPRQEITSAPLAIRSLKAAEANALSSSCVLCVTDAQINSLDGAKVTGTVGNAAQLGGVAANQFVQTNSTLFIRNQTDQQTSTSFNIDGTGAANVFNAATQFKIGGNHILSSPGALNLFAGVGAGIENTTGSRNAFFGRQAGRLNTEGSNNSFFGAQAGISNTVGDKNTFFGAAAGAGNTTGVDNAFFGMQAGLNSTTGNNNAFFGKQAGFSNVTGSSNSFFGLAAGFFNEGSDNSFFGFSAGNSNTTGVNNSFFGKLAGNSNTTGSNNTLLGKDADVGANNLNFATAIGAGAVVNASNTIALGRTDGSDKIVIYGLGIPTNFTYLCRNNFNQIATCINSPLAENEALRAKVEAQEKQLAEQKELIEALRTLVCQTNAEAAVCKPKE